MVTKEDIEMVNNHMKGCSPSLVATDRQFKVPGRFCFIIIRTVKIEQMTTVNISDNVKQLERSYTVRV